MTVQEELKQFDKKVRALVAKQKRNEKRITDIQSENHALSVEIGSLLNQQHALFINTHQNAPDAMWPFLLAYYPDSRIKSSYRECELLRIGLTRGLDGYYWKDTLQFTIAIGLHREDVDTNLSQIEGVKTLLPYIAKDKKGVKKVKILTPWGASRATPTLEGLWWLEFADDGTVQVGSQAWRSEEVYVSFPNADDAFKYVQTELYFQE